MEERASLEYEIREIDAAGQSLFADQGMDRIQRFRFGKSKEDGQHIRMKSIMIAARAIPVQPFFFIEKGGVEGTDQFVDPGQFGKIQFFADSVCHDMCADPEGVDHIVQAVRWDRLGERDRVTVSQICGSVHKIPFVADALEQSVRTFKLTEVI